uniref:Glyco_transf_7N domain-containing protein n=1 Tax=Onchocerca flexuosa TaxID=387005 RepID=A0A183HPC2_9BILA
LNTSTKVQPTLRTEKLQFSPSSSSSRITTRPRFKVLHITPKLYQKEIRRNEASDLKPVEIFQQTTKAAPKVTISGFTLVTALLDIGRGDWWEYRRPLESYYGYLENVLQLKVNLVIFVDQKSVRHVYNRRKFYQLEHITKVIPITLAELPLHRYMNLAMRIIADEQSGKSWDQQWDQSMKTHPEAKSAKYDILVNSKSYFLYNASVNHLK